MALHAGVIFTVSFRKIELLFNSRAKDISINQIIFSNMFLNDCDLKEEWQIIRNNISTAITHHSGAYYHWSVPCLYIIKLSTAFLEAWEATLRHSTRNTVSTQYVDSQTWSDDDYTFKINNESEYPESANHRANDIFIILMTSPFNIREHFMRTESLRRC